MQRSYFLNFKEISAKCVFFNGIFSQEDLKMNSNNNNNNNSNNNNNNNDNQERNQPNDTPSDTPTHFDRFGLSDPILGMRTCIVDPKLAALITDKCRNCHAMVGQGVVKKLFRCSRCHKEKYCDVECQKWDWFLRHKYECCRP